MQKFFSVYDSQGRIIRSGDCPEASLSMQASLNEFVMEGASSNEVEYLPDINNPVVTGKPTNTTAIDKTTVTADGVDMVKLTSIPINSSITLTNALDSTVNQSMVVTESTLEVLFEIAGTYVLKIELFPFLTFEAVINAT